MRAGTFRDYVENHWLPKKSSKIKTSVRKQYRATVTNHLVPFFGGKEMGSSEHVTSLLEEMGRGRHQAADELLPLVYDELRELARTRLASELPGQTFQPTALVHEAYLRLVGDEKMRWANRAHFFAAAAEAMRRILVETARSKATLKRGGGRDRVPLEGLSFDAAPPPTDLLALDEALTKLEAEDPRAGKVILLRHFAGLSIDETAQALELSPRTVIREWRCARAWLYDEISKGDTSIHRSIPDDAP